METLKRYCNACAMREACEYTFGKYYPAKSGGGEGCNHPFTDAAWSEAVLNAKRIAECAKVVKPSETDSPRIDAAKIQHKYIVEHKGVEYKTVARSEEQAINFVRFKIYGTMPLSSLMPFEAHLDCGTVSPTKMNNLAARLKRFSA